MEARQHAQRTMMVSQTALLLHNLRISSLSEKSQRQVRCHEMTSQVTSAPEALAGVRHWPRDLLAQVPLLAAMTVVGLTLGGLLIGYQPVGDDPDLMYRPIKMELARALRSGTLPFWSDRFGLGMPLMAESHVAALYPLNWVFYSLLDVETAYRWLMWLHYVALAGTTYLLARDYKISPWGAAISSVSFTLCGFMAAHACHEPFYCLMPYLPLCSLAGGAIRRDRCTECIRRG